MTETWGSPCDSTVVWCSSRPCGLALMDILSGIGLVDGRGVGGLERCRVSTRTASQRRRINPIGDQAGTGRCTRNKYSNQAGTGANLTQDVSETNAPERDRTVGTR